MIESVMAYRMAKGGLRKGGPTIKHGEAILGDGSGPRSFQEYVGQDQAKLQLLSAMTSAKKRDEPLDHTLLASGTPGIGKTTLARLIAFKLGVGMIELGGTTVFGADIPPDRFQPMRSAYLSLLLDSVEEAERVYALLAEGGQIFMPMEETFFAVRFAMLRDRFGTSWMLLHERSTS